MYTEFDPQIRKKSIRGILTNLRKENYYIFKYASRNVT